MAAYIVQLPFLFLKFWFLEAPHGLTAYFASLNTAFLQLFSLPLLIKTYFRPWKNEYREGLVGFSIGMGMFIKTFIILTDLILLAFLILAETTILLVFLMWPLVTIILLFL